MKPFLRRNLPLPIATMAYPGPLAASNQVTTLERNLREYLPAMVNMIIDDSFPWSRIESQFEKKIESRFAGKKDNELVTVEASIYDIIISVKSGKRSHLGLLLYLNSLFEELSAQLSNSEILEVRSAIKSLLLSFDKKYLNFVGELSVLNTLKKTSNIILHKHEYVLPNNKSVDFDIEIKEPNMKMLLEVLNIHLNEDKVENDHDLIERFFMKRIQDKKNSKIKGLDESINIHFIPVVWGSYDELLVYQDFFSNNKIDVEFAHEPMSFLSYSDDNGYYAFRFVPLSKLNG